MTGAWRVLPFEEDEAQTLLARGLELLDGLEHDPAPTLRWYRARRPAVVIGRGQDRALVVSDALPTVTRFSGGGAVLLDEHLLSLDVLIPSGHRLLDGTMSAVYLRIGAVWAAALEELGVPDVAVHDGPSVRTRDLAPRERLLAAVCYATLGRGEVTSSGRKLVGLAQRRRRAGALIQCGLLRRWRPESLLEALGADPQDAEITAAAAGLDDLVDDPADDATVMRVVAGHLERV